MHTVLYFSSVQEPPVLDDGRYEEMVDSKGHTFGWLLSSHPLSLIQCNSRLAAAVSNKFPIIW
jgi:hypothetical protein